jgi:hypothetical protein
MSRAERGLLLHVDAPVKQYIVSLNETHNFAIVSSQLQQDETKIFVFKNFEDAFGQEQETLPWLQGQVDRMLDEITFKPNA